MEYNIMASNNNNLGQIIVFGGLLFVVLYIFKKRRFHKKEMKKLYSINQVIDKTLVEIYTKKKYKMFRDLTVKDYYEIIGVKEENPFDMIYEAYKQKLKKFELKATDVKYYPSLLKEEALKNIALLEYSFTKIQEIKIKQ